jgi:23S rRNA (pseudouridine1915-N3)-methyltransferase
LLKIDLVAVGTRPPLWVVQGIEQYSSRMKRDCHFQILEIKTSDRKKKQSVATYQEDEAQLIGSHLGSGARVIAMDSRGKIWSTEQLAGKVEAWSQQTNHFQFVIGGPDGLADVILNRADEIWSLSNLTFPHFLVRVLLAEQIYRALMLNANHPYHK